MRAPVGRAFGRLADPLWLDVAGSGTRHYLCWDVVDRGFGHLVRSRRGGCSSEMVIPPLFTDADGCGLHDIGQLVSRW
ncbi:hypothetical protein [Mycobacterium uberis]|uniref:hypothetical protein n=1 Tax=Mycobacterium uberis TaxID=2162698 RepID=UPI001FB2139D|nr:hypothetical protein [Mycobacterium uberis]